MKAHLLTAGDLSGIRKPEINIFTLHKLTPQKSKFAIDIHLCSTETHAMRYDMMHAVRNVSTCSILK